MAAGSRPPKHRHPRHPRHPIAPLALGQLVSWGTLFYGVTFLAAPIGQDTAWSSRAIFGAFSFALAVAGLASPLAGRAFLRWGARRALALASILAGAGMATLAAAPTQTVFFAGWCLAGLAMALGLYEGAFAALREFGVANFRRSVVHVTLIGGFASTAFWPLTQWLEPTLGWRGTLWVFCVLHLFVVLPIHASLPRPAASRAPPTRLETATSEPLAGEPLGRFDRAAARFARLEPRLVLLALAFSSASFVSGGLAAHFAGWFHDLGIDGTTILLAGMTIGPSQVLARTLELWTDGRWSWQRMGTAVLVLQAAALALLALAPGRTLTPLVFAAIFGATNGLLTLVRPLAVADSAARTFVHGLFVLSAAMLSARALAPLAFAGLRDSLGVRATLGACVVCLAFASLAWALSVRFRPTDPIELPASATPAAPVR